MTAASALVAARYLDSMHSTPARPRSLAPLGALPILLLAGACSPDSGERVQITEKRVASVQPRTALAGVGLDERFGGGAPARQKQPPASDELPFTWETPEGWEGLESSQFRLVNLRPGGDPQMECYLTLLPQSGGGLLANVNRWRQQLELPAIDEAEAANLPQIELLGRPASFIDLSGPFQGMTGDAIADARLIGAILPAPEFTLFIKMTGPRDRVDEEFDRFRDFVASLALRAEAMGGAPDPDDHSGHDHPPGQHPAPEPVAGDLGDAGSEREVTMGTLGWTVPAKWATGTGSSMRLATYVPTEAPATECYITVLGGDGGGLLSNINRWRDQFGMSVLDTSEMMELQTVVSLGVPTTVVEARGPFRGMDGSMAADQALLGSVCIRPEGSVFVKMIGPPDEVEAERERFLAFIQSMEVTQ